MGVGTNVQARAIALYLLDALWRPADMDQRDGRILRQGNLNAEVTILRYVTEGSFDTFMSKFSVLESLSSCPLPAARLLFLRVRTIAYPRRRSLALETYIPLGVNDSRRMRSHGPRRGSLALATESAHRRLLAEQEAISLTYPLFSRPPYLVISRQRCLKIGWQSSFVTNAGSASAAIRASQLELGVLPVKLHTLGGRERW